MDKGDGAAEADGATEADGSPPGGKLLIPSVGSA